MVAEAGGTFEIAKAESTDSQTKVLILIRTSD